jgi:hypothetical protein
VTLRGLAEAPKEFEPMLGGRPGAGEEGLDDVVRLPHRGTAPIAFAMTARPEGTPPPVLASLSVSRAAIEDIVAAIQRHGF